MASAFRNLACVLAAAAAVFALGQGTARADAKIRTQLLQDAQAQYHAGQYFKAARYAFAAKEEADAEGDAAAVAEAYSWMALGLIRARLPNAASYFFIRTLESDSKPAIRRVLGEMQTLFITVGPDLFRKYLIAHTQYEDYDPANRSAYLYSLAKDALLSGHEDKTLGYVNGMSRQSPLWPYALQIRGTARAILGQNEGALSDFASCIERAPEIVEAAREQDDRHRAMLKSEAEDLQARCQAGIARTDYQMDRFSEADQAYDRIPKASLVWPDILFEQAWNAFGRQEYNRSLGKLVSYKSPALEFVYNSEADVLRAQSYLALCLYADANEVVNEFNSRYASLGEKVKNFVEGNAANLPAFYELGKSAARQSLYSTDLMSKMANRFVRGPYFQGLLYAEKQLPFELAAIRQFGANQPGVAHQPGKGFPGFLDEVLRWRLKTIKLLGGVFVKNSLMDYHAALISDFEKMAFIKLEMLRRAKEALIYKNRSEGQDRSWGNVIPSREDYQYYWSFNGEFWNDELGDYVFGLESECGNASAVPAVSAVFRGQDGS